MSQESTVGGWKQVEIGSLVSDVETRNPSSFESDTFEYIDISAVDQDLKTIVGARSINCNDAPSRARQLINTNDILVSTVRPNLNAVAIVPEVFDTAIASTGFCVLRPKQKQLDASYLFQWVKTPLFVSDMMRKATGASYPAVSDRIIFESKLPLPPLPEQRRIAAILDKAEALRVQRRAALAKLDQLAQSIFLEMFGDPATNPKGWHLESLQDLTRAIQVGVVVKPASHYAEDGVIALRSLNIKPNEITLQNIVRFDSNAHKTVLSKSTLKSGDVVVVRTGAPGVAAIVPNTLDGINCIDLIIVRPVHEKLHSVYFSRLMNSEYGRKTSEDGTNGAAQQHLNVGTLSKTKIPIPPISNQKAFAKRIEAIESLKAAHRASLAKLDALFASLQDRAFRGDL